MKFLFNVGGSDARALVLLLIATRFVVVVGVDAQAKTPIQAKAIAGQPSGQFLFLFSLRLQLLLGG